VPSARVRARSTAWLALLGAVGVVVSLVALVVRNAVGIVAALAALAVAAAAAWVAGTRQGRMRALAVAVVVVAVVGAAWALVAADAIDELVLLAVSVAAFVIGARSAFRDEAGGTATAPDRGVNGRGTSKVLVINPRSGGGRAELFGLAAEARRRGIEHILLEPGASLEELARDAAARADVIGMAGGDGSQALVRASRPPPAPPSCASRPGRATISRSTWGSTATTSSARSMRSTPISSRSSTWRTSVDGPSSTTSPSGSTRRSCNRTITVTRSSAPRHGCFLTFSATATATPPRSRSGALTANCTSTHASCSSRTTPTCSIESPGEAAGRGWTRAGWEALAVEVENAADAAALLSFDSVGQVKRFHGWFEWTADELVIDADHPVSAGIDGEAAVLDPPLRFTIQPAVLRVRLTQDAARERARRALLHEGAADVFSNLWSVATR